MCFTSARLAQLVPRSHRPGLWEARLSRPIRYFEARAASVSERGEEARWPSFGGRVHGVNLAPPNLGQRANANIWQSVLELEAGTGGEQHRLSGSDFRRQVSLARGIVRYDAPVLPPRLLSAMASWNMRGRLELTGPERKAALRWLQMKMRGRECRLCFWGWLLVDQQLALLSLSAPRRSMALLRVCGDWVAPICGEDRAEAPALVGLEEEETREHGLLQIYDVMCLWATTPRICRRWPMRQLGSTARFLAISRRTKEVSWAAGQSFDQRLLRLGGEESGQRWRGASPLRSGGGQEAGVNCASLRGSRIQGACISCTSQTRSQYLGSGESLVRCHRVVDGPGTGVVCCVRGRHRWSRRSGGCCCRAGWWDPLGA